MGVVHQKQAAIVPAHPGKPRHIRHIPQIIRTGNVHSGGDSGGLFQVHFQASGGNLTVQQISPIFRIEPVGFHIQQRGGGDKDLVSISPGGNQGPLPQASGIQRRQVNHGPNGQGRALHRIHRPPGAKQVGSVSFTFQNDARGVV